MKKILIGYKMDGTEIFKSEGIGCACLLTCKKCGKILDTMCCQDDVYCTKCAAELGYINKGQMIDDMERLGTFLIERS